LLKDFFLINSFDFDLSLDTCLIIYLEFCLIIYLKSFFYLELCLLMIEGTFDYYLDLFIAFELLGLYDFF